MTITIPSGVESLLIEAANSAGVDAETFVLHAIQTQLLKPVRNQATLAMFERWDAAQAPIDPQALSQQRGQLKQLMDAMNESRVQSDGDSTRLIFPR